LITEIQTDCFMSKAIGNCWQSVADITKTVTKP